MNYANYNRNKTKQCYSLIKLVYITLILWFQYCHGYYYGSGTRSTGELPQLTTSAAPPFTTDLM